MQVTKEQRATVDAHVLDTVRFLGEQTKRPVPFSCISLPPVVAGGARVVDRSLQRLRKAGKIRFRDGSGAGWVLA